MQKRLGLGALVCFLISSSCFAADFKCPLYGMLDQKVLSGNADFVTSKLSVDVDYDGKNKKFSGQINETATLLPGKPGYSELLEYLIHSGSEEETIDPLTPSEAGIVQKLTFTSDFLYNGQNPPSENSLGLAVAEAFDAQNNLFARFVFFADFEVFARCPL